MSRLAAAGLAILLSSCSLPSVVSNLEDQSPAPELGRPGWVKGPALAGAWVGGVFGAAASIIVLPVTWPLAQLADEQLSMDAEEFTWGPTSLGASAGHFLLGTPLDSLDFVFRRAWTGEVRPDAYEMTVQPRPIGPTDPAIATLVADEPEG